MKNRMFRMLWIALLICLIVSALAPAALADGLVSGDLFYYAKNGELYISRCNTSASGKLVIPDELPLYPGTAPVVGIDSSAFKGCSELTEVVIPDSVTSIGYIAFKDCSKLTEMVIPDSVTSIGGSAFSGCASLKKITMSKNIVSVQDEAFSDTAYYQNSANWTGGMLYLDNVLLKVEPSVSDCAVKEGTVCIASDAFYFDTPWAVELRSISLPASLKAVNASSWTFNDLTEFTVASGSTAFSAKDGVLFDKNKTELIKSVVPRSGSYTVPSTVKTIDDEAFWDQIQLETLTLPNGLTTIGKEAFGYCDRLQTINIPASVSSIGKDAFNGCISLQSVDVASGSKYFINQSGVVMDQAKTRILAITNEATGTVKIPGTVTSVESCSGNNVTKFTIESGNTVYSVVDGLLYESTYGGNQLLRCPAGKSGSCTIADGTIYFDSNAFHGCTAITGITIPASMLNTYLSFHDCLNLTAIHVDAENPNLAEQGGVLFSKDLKTLICVPAGLSGKYEIPSGTETIQNGAVYGGKLTELTIPASVTTIDDFSIGSQSITDVYYLGTRAKWDKISMGENSYFFNRVTLHCTDDAPAKPSITTQPKSASVKSSAYATFTVKASGSNLKYQWQYQKPGGSWTNCTSATTGYNTATLKVQGVTNSTNRNGYRYRCIVKNSTGSVTTNAVTLNVLAITTQPKAATVSGSNSASFKVAATGAGLKYQWQYLKPNGSWTNCTSATTGYNTAALKVQGVSGSTNRNGYQYRCKITDSAGNVITSGTAKLTVVELAITTQPKSASVKTTAYATFTVKASGSNLKYQWQYQKPGGNWVNCTSATTGYNTATLKVQGITNSTNRNGYQYRCKVTDGTSTVISGAAKLNVLSITTQPKAASVTGSKYASFTVKATGAGLKYQWQYLKPNGSWANCTSATSGYNTATLKVQGVTNATNRNGYQYRCIITDGAGNKITSSAAKLTVK